MNDVRDAFEKWAKYRDNLPLSVDVNGSYAYFDTSTAWAAWQAATARAQRVPLTRNEIEHGRREAGGERFDFTSGVRFAERHHGITAQPSGGKGE